VTLLFLNFLDPNKFSRLVDVTFLALGLTLLDFAVNGLPVFGGAVFAEAPFLELPLVLAFAVDASGACPNIQSARY